MSSSSPKAYTARLRGRLDAWSDDDEDMVPKRTERPVMTSTDLDSDSREQTPPEPSPPRKLSVGRRVPRAPCLDSDDEDEPFLPVRIEKAERTMKVDTLPSPKARISREAEAIDVFSPPGEIRQSRVSRSFDGQTHAGSSMQAPVQPGCTQSNDGRSRFLAYNMLGSITRVDTEAGFAHVEVDFHDTSSGMRVPSMTDYFGFTMAAMNERGSVFANPQRGENVPSTMLYRPFNSWTSNSEWSMRFPLEEEVKAVAVGTGWIAAVTSQYFLRVYSEAGLQRFVTSLGGPVVSLVGNGDRLAVVTHASSPLPSRDQMLEFMLLNVRTQKRLLTGRLPLSPGSTLTWIGFSEAGSLSSYDSQGVLRVYSSEFNGCWIPVFSAAAERTKENETYWVVGLNTTQVYCIVCKAPESQPQVMPKPVMSIINTSVPVVHSDLGADDLESDLLRGTLHLTHTRLRADEAAAAGRDDDEADEAVFEMEAELDRCILRLIASCCKGDKLARALELSSQLSLHKSMEGALKLVTAMRLPSLAERINQLLEEKSARERAEDLGAHTRQPQAQVTSSAYTPTSRQLVNTLAEPPRPQLSALKTAIINSSDRDSQGAAPTTCATADTSTAEPRSEFRSILKKSHKRVTADPAHDLTEVRPSDGSLKAGTPPKVSFVSLSSFKPSNPFAKVVDSKQNTDDKNDSLLQSLRKMQSTPSETKRKIGASSLQRPAKVGRVV
ncbi:protein ENHANCER OF LHP1 1 [Physcomitrium patens]|uniref:Uncharacterized protein n=1 Tax=Physcomitrium patens TaxID=3218 RepID=A0A2K1ID13_PHYPA|nr:WD repeat and HMG-box DNA-binding protein 1-like [Physcomitrium patens]XP_024366192.1 WD repeat and HMG-box DNA-binding protein 1-like [Physcomitrium patens]PNR27169.1 hypothetical protein PHYPA_030650 [Physcomitrium patens]|eukprot:XP_024366191.1 WD repeat and HMG-box DNA-binding protein 1-like [Physcomitrella patens]